MFFDSWYFHIIAERLEVKQQTSNSCFLTQAHSKVPIIFQMSQSFADRYADNLILLQFNQDCGIHAF